MPRSRVGASLTAQVNVAARKVRESPEAHTLQALEEKIEQQEIEIEELRGDLAELRAATWSGRYGSPSR